jgi:hypothetical protein
VIALGMPRGNITKTPLTFLATSLGSRDQYFQELIQNLQQNQIELAEAIKQLKKKDTGTKTLPQNEGGNQEKPHQDSSSHEKETTFVTMTDVANLLKQEGKKNPKEP